MNGWTKEKIISIVNEKLTDLHNSYEEFLKFTKNAETETLDFMRDLRDQIPNDASAVIIPKTPRVQKKRYVKQIQTIPEDDVIDTDSVQSSLISESTQIIDQTYDEAPSTRSRRAASQKASENIKIQQSLGLTKKLRRPSNDEETLKSQNKTAPRAGRMKRTKTSNSSSDDEEVLRPSKVGRINKKSVLDKDSSELLVIKQEIEDSFARSTSNGDMVDRPQSGKRALPLKRQRENSSESASSSGGNKKKSSQPSAKKANVIEDSIVVPESDTTIEASMYEDAIGKSIPMNSTMNPNTSMTIDRKMMNVTVVLESVKMPSRMNETVTITKQVTSPRVSEGNKTLVNEDEQAEERDTGLPRLRSKSTKKTSDFNALITEDESSPEKYEEKTNTVKKKTHSKEVNGKKHFTRSSLLSEDDDHDVVPSTPPRIKPTLLSLKALKTKKVVHKPAQLFSPYSKESVRKRVEAFEQVGSINPSTVDIDTPPRLTRTKTRAMAAAAANNTFTQTGTSAAQIAARKSLHRAKEIAIQKKQKENEEIKENNVPNSVQKHMKLMDIEKSNQKHLRITPITKSRLKMPASVNRIQNTPANDQIVNQKKALSATKSNLITSVESFLQPSKVLTKSKSNDNLAEKIKKVNDIDVRKKKEEALKALSEEKRRKREEKELKNKLAREAKEKLEMEKRLKQEREREEKAKAALLAQEKQREEYEKKRQLQIQRALEREERRRQEEQMKLLTLQEQEEAEQQLAEQKKREQETEKRKLAEARAQQQAAAEAARIKAQYLYKAKSTVSKSQELNSYVLESEPDDDDDASDDETRPKHAIPLWARPDIRRTQLNIQQYIPMSVVLAFFGAKKCTPDLSEMFKGIKKERLQRTSSAIWKTPPRYSVMNNSLIQ